MRKIVSVLIIMIVTLGLVGCEQNEVSETSGNIDIIISKDFANEKIESASLKHIKNYSVMDYMQENFQIETAYGGGFVNAINGIKSGFTDKKKKEKLDWFYYINGRLADIGCDDYFPLPNDVVIWDYHSWEYSNYVSNIVGAYPKNFTNKCMDQKLNLEIIQNGKYGEEVKALSEYLQKEGVEKVSISDYEENSLDKTEVNSIVVGEYDEIKNLPIVKQALKNRDKLGIFYNIEKDLKIYSFDNKKVETYDRGTVISSISKEYGLPSTVWLITGNDENLIKKAVNILYEKPQKLQGKMSILITENGIKNLPIRNN